MGFLNRLERTGWLPAAILVVLFVCVAYMMSPPPDVGLNSYPTLPAIQPTPAANFVDYYEDEPRLSYAEKRMLSPAEVDPELLDELLDKRSAILYLEKWINLLPNFLTSQDQKLRSEKIDEAWQIASQINTCRLPNWLQTFLLERAPTGQRELSCSY